MIPENINNGPCYRIEPYPGSCGCVSCCVKRNAEQIREWEIRDRKEREKLAQREAA
jgi:hypothetical protein